MNPHRLRAYSLLLIVAVIWGIAGPVIKLTLQGLPPDIFLLYRFFLSTLIAIPFFFLKGFKLPKDPKILGQVLLYGFLNSTATLGLLFWGTSKTSLLDMSLISVFGPLLMIFAGYLFLKDRITLGEKIGIGISFIGSAIILVEPAIRVNNGSGDLTGNLLVFASLLAGATSGVLVKRLLRQEINPLILSNLSFIVGFVTLLPIALLVNGLSGVTETVLFLPFPYHLGVIFMAFLSGTLAYSLSNIAQKSIELSEAALFSYLHPIFSAILAVYLLGDKITPPVALASLITLFGVFIAEFKKKRYNS